MKLHSLLSPILLLTFWAALGQDSIPPSKKIYKIALWQEGSMVRSGYLLRINDSSIALSEWPVRLGIDLEKNLIGKQISYRDISEIRLKRSHGAGRGAWKGAIIGLVLGAIAGFVQGDDPPENWFAYSATDKAILLGGFGAAAGTGVGALIGGLARQTFQINGKKQRFDDMRLNILSMAYGTPQNTVR